MEDKLILEGSSGVRHYGNICGSAQMNHSYGVFHVKSYNINRIMELPSGKGFADVVWNIIALLWKMVYTD